MLLCLTHNCANAEGHAIGIVRIVVIDIAVVIDITEVGSITCIRRPQPPNNNIFRRI